MGEVCISPKKKANSLIYFIAFVKPAYYFYVRTKKLLNFHICISVPACNYLFKVNNRNTRTRCELCSQLTIKTPELRHWRRSGVFIVNIEYISHLVKIIEPNLSYQFQFLQVALLSVRNNNTVINKSLNINNFFESNSYFLVYDR